MGPKRRLSKTERERGRLAHSSEQSQAAQSPTASPGRVHQRTLAASPGRTQVAGSTGISRPKRSVVPAHFKLEPEARGMSWAEEADLKRALYASMQGPACKRQSRKARFPRCNDSESEADDSGDSSNDGSTVSRESRCARKKCRSPVAKRAHRKFAQPGASPDSEYRQPCTSRQAARHAAPTRGSPVASAPVQVFTGEAGAPIYTEDFLNYLCYHKSSEARDMGSMAPFVNGPSGKGKASARGARRPCLLGEQDCQDVQPFCGSSSSASRGRSRSPNCLHPRSSSTRAEQVTMTRTHADSSFVGPISSCPAKSMPMAPKGLLAALNLQPGGNEGLAARVYASAMAQQRLGNSATRQYEDDGSNGDGNDDGIRSTSWEYDVVSVVNGTHHDVNVVDGSNDDVDVVNVVDGSDDDVDIINVVDGSDVDVVNVVDKSDDDVSVGNKNYNNLSNGSHNDVDASHHQDIGWDKSHGSNYDGGIGDRENRVGGRSSKGRLDGRSSKGRVAGGNRKALNIVEVQPKLSKRLRYDGKYAATSLISLRPTGKEHSTVMFPGECDRREQFEYPALRMAKDGHPTMWNPTIASMLRQPHPIMSVRVNKPSTAASSRAREKSGDRLRDVPPDLPLATPSDIDDPLGSYICTTLLRPSSLSDRFRVHHSYKIISPQVVDYVQDELGNRAALRAASVRSEELRHANRRGRRSATAPAVDSLPPYICSVTGYHSHVSVVYASGNLLSTRYAALLGSALAEDPTACLYMLIGDDLLKSLCSLES